MSRAPAAAAAPVLLFQLVEVAWGLMLAVLVCGCRGHASRANAAPIAVLMC